MEWHSSRWQWHRWQLLCIVIATCLLCFVTNSVVSQPISSDLPAPKVHSLPEFFASWQIKDNQTDYFSEIESTPLGYLVWSQFPIKVYVERSLNTEKTAANQRFLKWTAAVRQAIAEWQVYFPLEETIERETADILVLRSQPSREVKLNPETGLYDIPRAVTAETSYEFYLTKDPEMIAAKMTVHVSPNFAGASLLATIRHELGHALGIWGHSPEARDAMYFSQVSDPPTISPRDLMTLKKIYQQPTRLGWELITDY
ncbi:MAG: peptidase [Cyanobacteria bacterium P01_G01_bin.39]